MILTIGRARDRRARAVTDGARLATPEPVHPRRPARARSFGCMIVAAQTALLLAASTIVSPQPSLVWNASPSSPIGLYLLDRRDTIGAGDMVVAWPPREARDLAALRHYLPRNVPLVKHVAASAGDRVCASGASILINGTIVARRRLRDPAGRAMPFWRGCRQLAAGDLFLLTPGRTDAFDGRYFGITHRQSVVAKARLIWAR